MAATFSLAATAVANAATKNLLVIHNADSTKKVKVYRIWVTNPGTAAVTGGIQQMSLFRYANASAPTGGTAVTPSPHDPAKSTVTNLTVQHGATTNVTSIETNPLISVVRATDEIAAGGATLDELHNIMPLNLIFDAGYGDSNVEPLTLNQGEGVTLRTASGNAVGTFDIFAEITFE